MKVRKNPFSTLSKFELLLWIGSVVIVTVVFFIFQGKDVLTLCVSLIGVTALIFVAKGNALGQVLTIVFSLFYGIISLKCRYYGEMITYLGMTAPMALVALISWIRNPYKNSNEVKVSNISRAQFWVMIASCTVVTAVFYFILKALGNASLTVSTISITTSFLASYLTAVRSPYYALAYGANDIILIILWVIASIEDVGNVPMVACFAMFLLNDLYGFYNWQKMKDRQSKNT